MKDYELQLKIKNAPMLNAMRDKGINNAAELSRLTGISQSQIGDFLNLKNTCFNRHGVAKPTVIKIADYLSVTPDMLFPEQHLHDPLSKNTFKAQVDAEQMFLLASPEQDLDPVKLISDEGAFEKMIDCGLTSREQNLIRMRFSDDMTLREVGEVFDVTVERVRQIEIKALRKMRHPKRRGQIVDASGSYGDSFDHEPLTEMVDVFDRNEPLAEMVQQLNNVGESK